MTSPEENKPVNLDEMLRQVHHKAKDHLYRCAEVLWDEESGEDTEIESPAFAPFCGCDDCIVREVLMTAWTELIAGAVSYIEENAKDQEAINQIYGNALRRIATGQAPDPATLARMTLGEGS